MPDPRQAVIEHSPISAPVTRIINFAALHGVVLKPTQVDTTPFTLTPRSPFVQGRGALAALNSFVYDPSLAPSGQITIAPDWTNNTFVKLHLRGLLNQRVVVDCQFSDSSVPLYAQCAILWSVNLTYDSTHVGSFLTPPLTSDTVDINIQWDNRHPALGSHPPGSWTLLNCTVTPISA